MHPRGREGGRLRAERWPPLTAPSARASDIPSPSQFLGFTVGADRTLADYRQIASYFQALDAASPRVAVQVLGKTTLRRGHDHGGHLLRGEHRGTWPASRRSRGGSPIRAGSPTRRRRRWSREGKAVVLVTCNIHSTEIGASPDGDGVGARARHRRRTRRRSGGSTTWCCCSCRRSTPTARSWRPSGTASTSARGTRAAACPGSTTTTSATTTTATGSCSPRRRRGP